ncbi:uncharacterized protein [Chelonus insularis]|uniref:uncharacterized protein n=1 Tax=Chelonus insularis TaxID=460826 RepID=UPI00158CB692|nr:uncharacterized protein LOC118070361 [Chelonus insularis]
MVLGDNLGLNNVLGFSKSFSAISYCRFCKMTKNICQKSVEENTELLRNKSNYENDLSKQDPKSTGITENSIFNSVNKFHVCENYCVDVMHDLLEGLCKNDLVNILSHFIDKKIFTLKTLNYKIQCYKYPRNCNKPSIITRENLKDKKLRMSAAEMMTFTVHAGLIFGDLIPDDNDEYWELYKLLRQILVICLKSKISNSFSYLLTTLIEEHHSLYLKLFGDLIPKAHFCLHYPHIMRLVGPPRNFWTMRFEGKHRIFKQAARTTCNRQNLCLTLASRHQEHLNYAFENGSAFKETFDYKNLNHTKISEQSLKIISEKISGEFSLVAHIALGNVMYKINTFIIVRIDELPVFGCIKNILMLNNAKPVKTNDFELIVKVYETLGRNEHLQTYVIPRLGQTTIELLNFNSIIHYDLPHVPYVNVTSEINIVND